MTWLRGGLLCLLSLLTFALAACGDDDDNGAGGLSAQGVVDDFEAAIAKPGVVYHALGDDESEVWIDAENQRFRRQEPTSTGALTSVGQGWTRWSYDPFNNLVTEEDLSPTGARPRIDHPMVGWFEPLSAVAYSTELRLIGDTTADGLAVIALEARSPIGGDGGVAGSGAALEGRVELLADSYQPHAFEREEVVPAGQTPQGGAEGSEGRKRVVYTSEELSVEDVPEGFFERAVVDGLVQTVEENIQKTKAIGLAPLWLGEFLDTERGLLVLPETDNFFVNTESQEAEIHYSLVLPVAQDAAEPIRDSVIIRLAHGIDNFQPPLLQEFAGDLPETIRDVPSALGQVRLIFSRLTPSDLPCPDGGCPASDAPLYLRLIATIGETSVQIETSARIDGLGQDRNGYNTQDGIIALAETLVEAEG